MTLERLFFMSRFTDFAWLAVPELRRAIHRLPFNQELAAGTLSPARFQYYITQDSLYLGAFSRALALAAAKAPDTAAMVTFAEASQNAMVVEHALHESVFAEFGLDPTEAGQVDPSPTCQAYNDFLIATAQIHPYEALVAAVLPCFWIYWEVGIAIAKTASPDNPYRAWIDTYTDPAFRDAVEAVKAINDRTAAETTAAMRAAMLRTFIRSTQYEWMFWDAAYRQETWPIG